MASVMELAHELPTDNLIFNIVTMRSKTLIDGFMGELQNRKTSLKDVKNNLESLYGQTLGDEQALLKNTELIEKINKALLAADASFTNMNGTIKSIKTAVESWY